MSTHLQDRADAAARAGHRDGGVDVLDSLAGLDDGHRPHGNPLAAAWRFLISMRTGLLLILALGFLTFAGTVLMQAPAEAVGNVDAYQEWYSNGPQAKYGGWAPVLSALGLFRVFSTWYFLALFGLLAVSILACSVNRAPRLWRVATRPRTSMSETFFSHAPLKAAFDLPLDADAAADRVRTGLRGQRFRVLAPDAPHGADVYGDRFRWGPFGTVVAHLSFLVIMVGFVVSAAFGFRVESFIAPIGTPVAVGHGTGLTVVAHSFNDSYYDNGTPRDYVSDVSLLADGVEVARHNVRVNDPLIHDDVWFHQGFFGIGADIRVTGGGQELYAQMVPLQWQSSDGRQSIGQFAIPGRGVTAYVIQAASGQTVADLPPGTVAIEVHRDGVQQPDLKVVEQGRSVEVDGLTYTFERNRQYTGLTVKRDPGSIFVWVGSILLILGSCLVFFVPHRRIWVRVRPNADGTSHVMVAAPLKRDPAFEPVFRHVVHRIQAEA